MTKIIAAVKTFLNSTNRRSWAWFAVLSLAALALRFCFAPLPGNGYDMGAFSYWATRSRHFAFFGFYSFFDYPRLSFPNYALYFPILAVMGEAAQVATAAGRVLLKMPAILGDVFLAGAVFASAKPRWKLAAAAFVLFNPAVWYVSAVFGQTDCLHAAFMVLAVLFATKNKYRCAWASLAIAVFFKIQAISILPLIVALNFKSSGFKKMTVEIVPATVLTAAMTIPYLIVSSSAVIWRSFRGSFGMFPMVSINAWNPWYLLTLFGRGDWVYDTVKVAGISYKTIGLVAFAVAAGLIIAALPKRPGRTVVFAAAAAMCLAFFMLPTEMHERYSYPFIPFIAVIFCESPFVVGAAVLASLVIFLDINFVQKIPVINFSFVNAFGGCLGWTLVFIGLFIAYFAWYLRRAHAEKQVEAAAAPPRPTGA